MPRADDRTQGPDLHPDDVAWTESLVLRRSPRHGLGVVARQRFAPGDVVERVPLIIVPDDDTHFFLMQGTTMHRYGMPGVPDVGRCSLLGGFGAFYNHEPDPALANVTWTYAGGRLMLYTATRTIEPGDELSFDYGNDPGF